MKHKLNCIFLIDDSIDTNFLNSQFIKYADCANATMSFTNAQDAIDYISISTGFRGTNTEFIDPDLIFLDMSMPKMDGWDFVEKYSNLKANLSHLPIIIMLSASADPEEEQRALNNPDISGFYAKPLSNEIIHGVFSTYFPDRS